MSEVPLISIVDDDALARDGIRELVESLGYKAIAFESAEHFLELQEALKAQGYQTPIILITAFSNKNYRTRALENGAIDFLNNTAKMPTSAYT